LKSKKKIYWICQIGGWSLYGLLNFLAYATQSGRADISDVLGTLFQILFYVLSTHGLRWVIKRRKWFSFPSVRLIPVILLTNLGLGVINYLFLLATSYFLNTLILSVELKMLNITFSVLGPSAMYLLWSLLYFTYHYFEEYSKSLQYEAVIRDIELNHLKSQLNPHFIFNALNSIRGLVDENPKKSKYAITQLSNILRNSLIVDKKKLIHLSEELETVKDYLSLESIRYEERLEVIMNIEEGAKNLKIPPMMIQTLVENGIKHGIARLKQGGTIDLHAQIANGLLKIQIRNSGHYQNNAIKQSGFGISNTKKRLALIYGDAASFRIFNESEHTVLTEINLPTEI